MRSLPRLHLLPHKRQWQSAQLQRLDAIPASLCKGEKQAATCWTCMA